MEMIRNKAYRILTFGMKLMVVLWCGFVSANQVIHFVHSDHLGTPQALTDENQSVVWTANYEPFGEVEIDEDPDGDGRIVVMPIRFPGQYADAETGYYYNYYRDYDPTLGRYIQSDPIGLRGGLNTYGYVYQNPINKIDPLGLWSVSLDAYSSFGLGGGITFGLNNDTGEWFGAGRLGLGFGGGFNFDPTDNGPTDRGLTTSSGGNSCEVEAGSSGFSVGTYAGIGASAFGIYDYGASARGGRNFDGSGGFYSDGPAIGPGLNMLGGPGFGAGLGGGFGIEVSIW